MAREKGMSTLAVFELERGRCRPYFSLLMHLLPKLESMTPGGGGMKGMEMYNRWAWGQGEYHGPTPAGFQFLISKLDKDSLLSLEMSPVLAAEFSAGSDINGTTGTDLFPSLFLPGKRCHLLGRRRCEP